MNIEVKLYKNEISIYVSIYPHCCTKTAFVIDRLELRAVLKSAFVLVNWIKIHIPFCPVS